MKPRTLQGPMTELFGSAVVPSSKSLTNRALIVSAVADGGEIVDPLDCDDTRVLARALSVAGWDLRWDQEIRVGARRVRKKPVVLDLADSGTGSRLILGLLAATPGRFTVDGSERLRERPMRPLLETLENLGAKISSRHGYLPVEVDGTELMGGNAVVTPEISSQFISALVLAAPLMRNGLDLEVSGALPSAPYLDLTEDVLRSFGGQLEVDHDKRRWRVNPYALTKTRYQVEGDWSAAAFVFAAVAVAGGEIVVGPLVRSSRQGDRAVLDVLVGAGLEVREEGRKLRLSGPVTRPFEADLRHTPDLFPALAVVASSIEPGSCLRGLDHLRHKESDRLAVMTENLRRLGGEVEVDGNSFTVKQALQVGFSEPPVVTAANDHRVAMAMAVAALRTGRLKLDDGDCVGKSFPGFWDMWASLLAGGGHR